MPQVRRVPRLRGHVYERLVDELELFVQQALAHRVPLHDVLVDGLGDGVVLLELDGAQFAQLRLDVLAEDVLALVLGNLQEGAHGARRGPARGHELVAAVLGEDVHRVLEVPAELRRLHQLLLEGLHEGQAACQQRRSSLQQDAVEHRKAGRGRQDAEQERQEPLRRGGLQRQPHLVERAEAFGRPLEGQLVEQHHVHVHADHAGHPVGREVRLGERGQDPEGRLLVSLEHLQDVPGHKIHALAVADGAVVQAVGLQHAAQLLAALLVQRVVHLVDHEVLGGAVDVLVNLLDELDILLVDQAHQMPHGQLVQRLGGVGVALVRVDLVQQLCVVRAPAGTGLDACVVRLQTVRAADLQVVTLPLLVGQQLSVDARLPELDALLRGLRTQHLGHPPQRPLRLRAAARPRATARSERDPRAASLALVRYISHGLRC
mmetsp:Transcript_17210/g.65683  ORF Transcript_17210/g.65683 Transcript_17210/m.65683 type:complete len:433 (-) Transcript_17210:120-1418(-)